MCHLKGFRRICRHFVYCGCFVGTLIKCKYIRFAQTFCLHNLSLDFILPWMLYMCSCFLAVGSWITRFFSSWERKNCSQSCANSQNDNYSHSKRQPMTIWSDNSCHFVNLLTFASSSFLLSMRKITWLNSQQPKNRGHVEDLSAASSSNQPWPCLFF